MHPDKRHVIALLVVLILVSSGLLVWRFNLVPEIGEFFASEIPATLSSSSKLVGAYYMAPGFINSRLEGGCGYKGCSWPEHLPPHPTLGQYDTGTPSYIHAALDKAASLGIDFLILDESNGIHHGAPPLEADLLAFLDIADARIRAGRPTPHITIMSPMPGVREGAPDDANWIWNNLVHKNGTPRPSWVWLDGRPLWGVYTASNHDPINPLFFRTDFIDSRYFIRYIANFANTDCTQQEIDKGTVWCWASPYESAPLYSSISEEITIQNGYSNLIACQDYWDKPLSDFDCISYGFTSAYYHSQWDSAISHNPKIIVITSYGAGAQIEGGTIEARTDFSPPTLYEDITRERVLSWKGTLALTNVGMPLSNNATPVSPFVPATMIAGQTYTAVITMTNSGTTTWTKAAGHTLGSQNPENTQQWGPFRAELSDSDSIAPGQSKTFSFNVTAPTTPGTYNFQWQMLQEGVAWFGQPSTNISVTVAPVVTTSPSPSTTTIPVTPAINSFTATPSSITSGETVTLSWNIDNASTIEIVDVMSKPNALAHDVGTYDVYPATNTTYMIQATRGSTTVTATASVTVAQATVAPAPTLVFYCNGQSPDCTPIPLNGAATLYWSSANVDTCTASGDWAGSKSFSGSEEKTNITSTTSYTLSCSGPGGSVTKTVSAPIMTPALFLECNAQENCTIAYGGTVVLRWVTFNATRCDASGDWNGSKGIGQSWETELQPDLTKNKRFTLTCNGPSGQVQRSTEVTVLAQAIDVCPNIAGDQLTIPEGYILNFAGNCIKRGDVNGDTIVDILDYNALIAKFGNTTNLGSEDIIINGKVDIYDYNALVLNLGK